MKRLLIGMSILSILLISTAGQKALAQDVEVSYQDFYDNLAPYGQWVYDPQYGNVWVPNEDGDFRPYGSRGNWVMTDYGNTWVSQDPWGWACYHYGRWTYDPYYGWVWIPGYEWAPAWVTWRFGGGYSGWAPLGPGISIGVSFNCPESWWIFMEPHYMYQRDCFRYWRGPAYNTTYVRQTTIINNYYMDNRTNVRYNYGPRSNDIERVTHQPVQVYRVNQTNRPGAAAISGNRLSMYRPVVQRNTSGSARPNNVMQAPRAINSRPQSAANIEPNRQPQFRQEMQRQNANNPGGNRMPANNSQAPQRYNQTEPQQNSQAPQRYNQTAPQQNSQAPQRYNQTEPQQNSRPEPQRYQQPAPQQNSRPEPQRYQQPAPQHNSRPEPQRYQQPAPQQNSRPEPQRYQQPAPQQNSRPEPQRYQQPAPPQNSRPEPQRYQQPAPPQNSRPEPQRYQQPAPPQNSRPEPQRYQQPAPAPHQQPAPPARSQPAPAPTTAPAPQQSNQRGENGPIRR